MAILRAAPQIRLARPGDYERISRLINYEPRVHRHLDWKPPLDWLGAQPFLVAEHQGAIQAVLACPPDPPGVAWIRLFSASGHLSAADYFRAMFERAREELGSQPGIQVGAIALFDWFSHLLLQNGFQSLQKIVVLEYAARAAPPTVLPSGVEIRSMEPDDLPAVTGVDRCAFEPLWHNSEDGLTAAYRQSDWATVACRSEEIIGYQISTAVPMNGHLARLAVLPNLQSGGIGRALVADLLRHFTLSGAWRVTVNTQNDNLASLHLYESIGFHRTSEVFPVYIIKA